MVKILIKSSLDLFYSQHTDARYWYSNSVRPSACPSVRYVPVSDENGLTYCHSFFSPHGSPVILVLSALNVFTKFRRGHPCVGAKYRWGIKILRFSTNKSLYLPNDTRYSHSYYGRRIGTAISNNLERTVTLFSRSHHSLTLNISRTATDTATVTIEDE